MPFWRPESTIVAYVCHFNAFEARSEASQALEASEGALEERSARQGRGILASAGARDFGREERFARQRRGILALALSWAGLATLCTAPYGVWPRVPRVPSSPVSFFLNRYMYIHIYIYM